MKRAIIFLPLMLLSSISICSDQPRQSYRRRTAQSLDSRLTILASAKSKFTVNDFQTDTEYNRELPPANLGALKGIISVHTSIREVLSENFAQKTELNTRDADVLQRAARQCITNINNNTYKQDYQTYLLHIATLIDRFKLQISEQLGTEIRTICSNMHMEYGQEANQEIQNSIASIKDQISQLYRKIHILGEKAYSAKSMYERSTHAANLTRSDSSSELNYATDYAYLRTLTRKNFISPEIIEDMKRLGIISDKFDAEFPPKAPTPPAKADTVNSNADA